MVIALHFCELAPQLLQLLVCLRSSSALPINFTKRAALGLGTSIAAMARLGWRHLAVVTGTSLVILVVATGGIILLG